VVESLIERGRPPERDEIAARIGAADVDTVLRRLQAADLVVLSEDGRCVVGAYQVTARSTPHELRISGRRIHAMCAVDALSVAAVYSLQVQIHSRCRHTGEPIVVAQHGRRILSAQPLTTRVGVRWQPPVGSAAASLCLEMVFLRDDDAATHWSAGDTLRHDVYTLEQAQAFGERYFAPLLRGGDQ
jgi:mercuric reductase